MQTCANGGEICANGGKRQSGQRLQELLAFFRNKKPPLTEGKVSTGAGVMSKMMCLRNEVVPAEQMMCLRNDVPLRGNGGRSFSREGLCIAAEPSQFRCAAERGQNREISSNLFN